MERRFSKYVIIGAGLSGLTSAYYLQKSGETDFLLLESRERLGGRILTNEGIDLGATWFQTHHERLLDLIGELDIDKFYQYSKGNSVMVYSTMAPEHYFESDPNTPPAYRISGNSKALINALAKPFSEKINTKTTAMAISEAANGLTVETDKGMFSAEKVIVTVPPRIALRISFSPELPVAITETMTKTHTWMSNAMKVGLTFKKPFWRGKNMSGMLIGQVGAVTELYDHCDTKGQKYALMGFINEGLRDFSPEARQERILNYIAKYLGREVMDYQNYFEKDWSQDPNTSCEAIKSIYMSPSYGNPVFEKAYLKNKLLFSGAETSPVSGGYMDGAVYSGIKAAEKAMQL